jgi:hypothetical protein
MITMVLLQNYNYYEYNNNNKKTKTVKLYIYNKQLTLLINFTLYKLSERKKMKKKKPTISIINN